MIDYDAFCRLKQLREQGRTPPQIAHEMHLHIQTVRRWLAHERFQRSATDLFVGTRLHAASRSWRGAARGDNI